MKTDCVDSTRVFIVKLKAVMEHCKLYSNLKQKQSANLKPLKNGAKTEVSRCSSNFVEVWVYALTSGHCG